MRVRIIKYTSKYRIIAECIILISFFFTPWLVFSIVKKVYPLIALFSSVIILALFAIVWSLKYNIIFDYKNHVVVALEPGRFRKIKVNINEIKRIQFLRVETERRKERIWDFFPTRRNLFSQPSENHVYNFGQQYIFKITKLNGESVIINYNSLYRCKSSVKIERFETKVNEILREFDEFRYPSKNHKR